MNQGLLFLFAAGCALFASSVPGADLALKVLDKEPPQELHESVRKALQPKAIQLLDGLKPVYEIWLSKEIPIKSKPASPGQGLQSIPETTLIGAVVVGPNQHDYKDNDISEGVYTARLVLQPQDGNHLGTAEYPYFAVLVPGKTDTSLVGFTTTKSLVKASGKETSSGHPIVLSIRPASMDSGDAPKLDEPAPEHRSIYLKVPARAEGSEQTPIPLELVYQGKGKS